MRQWRPFGNAQRSKTSIRNTCINIHFQWHSLEYWKFLENWEFLFSQKNLWRCFQVSSHKLWNWEERKTEYVKLYISLFSNFKHFHVSGIFLHVCVSRLILNPLIRKPIIYWNLYNWLNDCSKERTFSTSLVLLTRTKKTKARVTKGQILTLRRGVRYCQFIIQKSNWKNLNCCFFSQKQMKRNPHKIHSLPRIFSCKISSHILQNILYSFCSCTQP